MAKSESKVQVQVEDIEVKVEENVLEEQVQFIEPVAVSKKVKIKARTDIRIYIGSKWFEFKKGEERTVDQFVKDILLERGALDVI